MKKIPTLFRREFDEQHHVKRTYADVTDGCEWVLDGIGEATVKVDGAACAIINGVFYKRYDARNGKPIPNGAIPCQAQPDPVTGHFPCWVKVDPRRAGDKWFINAWNNTPWIGDSLEEADGTYEAVGLHFQGNPYGLDDDFLEKHGRIKIKDLDRSYTGIKEWLRTHEEEGIVFWRNGKPGCKIKRSDFGFEWAVKDKRE